MSQRKKFSFGRIFRRITGRTLTGIVLVVGSAVGVGFTVNQAQSGDRVFMASRFVAEGTTITPDDVVEVVVVVGSTAGVVDRDMVVGRTLGMSVGAGEIFTERVLAPQNPESESLRLDLATAPSSGITAGSRVTVWSLPAEGGPPPQQVAENATVVGVHTESLGAETSIDVVIDRRQVPAVLGAIASGSSLMVTHPGGK